MKEVELNTGAPREQFGNCGDISDCHSDGEWLYWHLVGGGQGVKGPVRHKVSWAVSKHLFQGGKNLYGITGSQTRLYFAYKPTPLFRGLIYTECLRKASNT